MEIWKNGVQVEKKLRRQFKSHKWQKSLEKWWKLLSGIEHTYKHLQKCEKCVVVLEEMDFYCTSQHLSPFTHRWWWPCEVSTCPSEAIWGSVCCSGTHQNAAGGSGDSDQRLSDYRTTRSTSWATAALDWKQWINGFSNSSEHVTDIRIGIQVTTSSK